MISPLSLINSMEFEPAKPADGRFSFSSQSLKDFMWMFPLDMAHPDGGGIND